MGPPRSVSPCEEIDTRGVLRFDTDGDIIIGDVEQTDVLHSN